MVKIKEYWSFFTSSPNIVPIFMLILSAAICIWSLIDFIKYPCIVFAIFVAILCWQNGWAIRVIKLGHILAENEKTFSRKDVLEVNRLIIVLAFILLGIALAYLAGISTILPLKIVLSIGFGLSFWLIGFKTEYRFKKN